MSKIKADMPELQKTDTPEFQQTAVIRPNRFLLYLRNNYMLYLFLLLPTAYFLIFRYGPLYGILIAFKEYNIFQGVWASPWNNFASFKEIFAMPQFLTAVRNTFLLNGLDLVLGFPAPVILSIILSEIFINWFKKVSQTVLYLPHFLSWVIIGSISLQLLSPESCLINNLFMKAGLS